MKSDWKIASNYPQDGESISLHRWAFEFLRRNQGFMDKYMAAKSEPKPAFNGELVGWSETPEGKVLKEYGVAHPVLKQWMDAGISDSPFIFDTHPIYVRSCRVETAGAMFTDEAVGKYFNIALEQPDKVVLEFDLSQPLNPQLERAKKMLLGSQKSHIGKKKTAKATVKMYPWYLRVLDAYSAGMHPAKICEVLSQEYTDAVSDDTLKNWKKAGEFMRDGGYRDLVKKPTP